MKGQGRVLQLVIVIGIVFIFSLNVGCNSTVYEDLTWEQISRFFDGSIPDIYRFASAILDLISKKQLNTNSISSLVSYFNFLSLKDFFQSSRDPGNNKTPILILSCNRDSETFLEELLKQLNSSRKVETTFVVLSHDHFNTSKYIAIEKLSRSLPNLHLVQLFFPYGQLVKSIQGSDNNPLKNAEAADSARFHWLFSFHQMFNSFSYLSHYSPSAKIDNFPTIQHLVYLEDDYWVLPDFYELALKMIPIYDEYCPHCLSINLGAHNDQHDRTIDGMVQEWEDQSFGLSDIYIKPAGLGNGLGAGLVVSRSVWKNIERKQGLFCKVKNSPHWDLVLNRLMYHFELNFTNWQIAPNKSRVHHAGSCTGIRIITGENEDAKCKNEQSQWNVDNQKNKWNNELLEVVYRESDKERGWRQVKGCEEQWKWLKQEKKQFKESLQAIKINGNEMLSHWCTRLPFIKLPFW